jgi:hypothetical protein
MFRELVFAATIAATVLAPMEADAQQMRIGFTPGSHLRKSAPEVRYFPDAIANPRDYRVVPGEPQ